MRRARALEAGPHVVDSGNAVGLHLGRASRDVAGLDELVHGHVDEVGIAEVLRASARTRFSISATKIFYCVKVVRDARELRREQIFIVRGAG
jgi:hypothetical protein